MSYAQPFGGRKQIIKQRRVHAVVRRPRLLTIQRTRQLSGIFDTLKSSVTSLVSTLPSTSVALNAIKAKVGEFLGLPARFDRANSTINAGLAHAQQQRDDKLAAKFSALKSALGLLSSRYPAIESQVSNLIAAEKQGVSASLITQAVSTSSQVAAQLAGMKKIESTLKSSSSAFTTLKLGFPILPIIAVASVALFMLIRKKG